MHPKHGVYQASPQTQRGETSGVPASAGEAVGVKGFLAGPYRAGTVVVALSGVRSPTLGSRMFAALTCLRSSAGVPVRIGIVPQWIGTTVVSPSHSMARA